MGLQITVTHLTRMRGDRICVAGLTDDGKFVRPDCRGFLHRSDVPRLFDLGARVDLGAVRRTPSRPQVENVVFERSQARQLGVADATTVRDLLRASARASIDDIFGAALKQTPAGSCYVDPGTGSASLGTVAVDPDDFVLRTDSYGALRGWWSDPGRGRLHLAVTDLRLFMDASTVDDTLLAQMVAECADCDELFLSVGLTKNWGQRPGHWLQLNNILPTHRSERDRM